MPQCPGCNSENDTDARFCRRCGTALTPAETRPPVLPPAATSPANAAGRMWMAAVLMLIGLGFAGSIGYWFGVSRGASSATTSETAASAQSANADHAQRDSSGRKTNESPSARQGTPRKAREPAAEDRSDNKDDDENDKPPESPERRLVLLRQAMAQCGRFNVFCLEKARWRYCPDMWGKVPECPQANPGIQSR